MQDIERYIRDDVVSDVSIQCRDLVVEVRKKGLFKRRSQLCISGTVRSENEKSKIQRIAERQAGDNYDVVNSLSVKT